MRPFSRLTTSSPPEAFLEGAGRKFSPREYPSLASACWSWVMPVAHYGTAVHACHGPTAIKDNGCRWCRAEQRPNLLSEQPEALRPEGWILRTSLGRKRKPTGRSFGIDVTISAHRAAMKRDSRSGEEQNQADCQSSARRRPLDIVGLTSSARHCSLDIVRSSRDAED
jgi:hypothetical protein